MKRYFSAIVMLVALCSLAVSGRAKIMEKVPEIPGVPYIEPYGFEPIRADVINPDPADFTIDVRKFANIGVNEEAEYFALYTGAHLPEHCGDFRNLTLPYWKPSKYKRTFDLRDHEEVLKGIEGYECVVVRNTPSKT